MVPILMGIKIIVIVQKDTFGIKKKLNVLHLQSGVLSNTIMMNA